MTLRCIASIWAVRDNMSRSLWRRSLSAVTPATRRLLHTSMFAFALTRRVAPATRQLTPHVSRLLATSSAKHLTQRRHSSTQPAYPGHVPLNWFEHAFMFAGASYMAMTAPARHGENTTSS